MRQIRVLVLCTGNSCRSQMTEGFIRRHSNGRVEVYSAGLEPKGVHPLAIQVMEELGIDISKHSSDSVTEYLGGKFDYVIKVCDNAVKRCPVFPGPVKSEHWPFTDPAAVVGSEEEVLSAFRKVRDQIDLQVRGWLSQHGAMLLP